jgi:AraC-like DNA-binding protein
MTDSRYARHYEAENALVSVDYVTDHGQYHAAHWQADPELIYLLNGNARIVLDGETVSLVQGDFLIVDTNQVYELHCKESFMQIRVRVSREFLLERAGNRMYRCNRGELTKEQLEPYLKICDLFKELVPLYIHEPDGYRLRTEAIVLQILYEMVRHFSIELYPDDLPEVSKDRERIREILKYIEEHYAEPMPLAQIAGEFGLSREYFSRLFRKSIGIPFSQHLSRVRIAHIYRDLFATDTPVMELIERHGFTNYKLFSHMFRELYGMTPREVRKLR